jgi:CxxC motif-containing protein
MPKTIAVICIGCPLGCRISLNRGKNGKITVRKGAHCRVGEKYSREEVLNPVRLLTTTVKTGKEDFPLLPVRTSRPIPRALLLRSVRSARELRVNPPVKLGDVLMKNIAGSGADLVASAEWK